MMTKKIASENNLALSDVKFSNYDFKNIGLLKVFRKFLVWKLSSEISKVNLLYILSKNPELFANRYFLKNGKVMKKWELFLQIFIALF